MSQAKEGPKLVHSAKAPLPSLLNTHHFDEAKDGGCVATMDGTGWVLGGDVQDLGELVVGELAI